MAPLPQDDQSKGQPTSQPAGGSWTTATIIVGAVFLLLALAFIGSIIAFCIHKRKLRNKLPPEHRPRSYHPFRTETTDKSSLLSGAQSPEDERSSMFSYNRSSVSLYVDAAPVTKQVSNDTMETVSLIPLHVTPDERLDSLAGEISYGSSVSGHSRSSISLSPINPEERDLGMRPTRPRSTSSTSNVRYYGRTNSNSPDSIAAPQLPTIPKIVRTVSD